MISPLFFSTMTRPSNDLLFLPLLLFLLLLLISNSPTVNSFRFFKSLWRSGNSSTTTTTTSTTISPPPPVPEKFISSSTSPQPEPPATSTVSSIPHLAFYLARYPHLNESYLAELVTASPNVTAHVERFSASDHHPHPHHPHHHHNETDHLPFLEEEEEELFHHGNVTLHLQPAPPSTPLLNISTYFEIGGSSSPQSKPPSPLSPLTSDQNQDDEKPFSVLITNDKTMAYLRFDLSGRQLDACTLYDIEKEPEAALKVPLQTGLQPLTADYKTLLEAVRRCTEMSRKQLQATPGNVLATSTTTTSTTTTSTSTSTTPSPALPLGGNETSVTDVPPITSNTTVSASLIGKPPPPPSNNSSISLGGSSVLPSSNSSASSSGGPGANFISMWKGIVPGTKWCGLGDSALDYHDLGGKADVDLCCRAHDHCPVRLKAFRMGYGLINFSFYTK